MISINSWRDVERKERERERPYIRFGTILFKAGTQRAKKNSKHDQQWK